MIWAKRGAAVVVAAGLIVGAVLIRTEVIEGDDGGTPDVADATTLVCLTELKPLCDAIASNSDVTVEHLDVGGGISEFAELESGSEAARRMWLTIAPFPDIVEQARAGARDEPLGFDSQAVASSDLVLALPSDKHSLLELACDDPVDWRCLGDAAGKPWDRLVPEGGGTGNVRPAFSSIATAVGRLAVAAALGDYFGDRPIDPLDPEGILWLRRLVNVVPASALSSGSPITALRQRRGLDVAVGVHAELGNPRDTSFDTIYAGEMARVDVVLAVPDGVSAPSRLVTQLTEACTAAGWSDPGAAVGTVLPANTVSAATQAWSNT
jgi:hypothetical protein